MRANALARPEQTRIFPRIRDTFSTPDAKDAAHASVRRWWHKPGHTLVEHRERAWKAVQARVGDDFFDLLLFRQVFDEAFAAALAGRIAGGARHA